MKMPTKKSKNSILDMPLIKGWLEEAGSIALKGFQKSSFTYKADRTPVTETDRTVEQFLVKKIQNTFPSHGIIAEEQTSIHGDEYTWVIDPIDGTSAYIMGVPTWCIAVGILKNHEPYFGLVYLPVTGESYHAYSDRKAYWNKKEIHVSENELINEQSTFCISTFSCNIHKIAFPGRIFSLGSGIYQHLLVSRGAASASVTLQPKIWDLAPAWPILKAAGAAIHYVSGESVHFSDHYSGQINTQPILIGHASFISELSHMIKKIDEH